ncbi:MAG: sensor histidine kinase, partial [Peptostreptococcaceae bacterium]
LIDDNHENLKFEEHDSIMVIREDAQTKFKYISTINKILLDINGIRIKVVGISILCVLSIILVTYVVINNYSKKLKKILIRLKQIQSDDLETKLDIQREDDELDTISLGINSMCDSLQESIEKNYISEVKQKQAEINALQAQIKPHFLYNTLEVIRMCALANKNTEVATMIYNLAYMFRYSTYNNKQIVTLKEEIKYSKMYLDLCCTRYKGILSYEINIDEELSDCIIPKFIVQPIVENFIVHGMRKDSNDNLLKINILKDNLDLKICIEDNGTGIDEDKINEISLELKQNIQKPSSIGLMNINNRVRLKFGEEYGLCIKSEKGKQTMVVCKLPLLKEEGDYV